MHDNAPMVTKKMKGLGMGLEALLGPKVSEAPAAKEAAERLVPKMSIQREQALVGVAGLLVITIAAALSLVSG